MVVDRGRLFGADLRLREIAGNLDLTRDDAGELAPLGWPDYGSRLHELIGQPNVARTHALLMVFARDAVEQDPRVEKVLDVRALVLDGERDVVRLELEVLLIAQPNSLNLVLDVPLEPA